MDSYLFFKLGPLERLPLPNAADHRYLCPTSEKSPGPGPQF